MAAKPFVDLFAGAGGLSLGLEQAGFAPVHVNEVNADSLETYLMNRDAGHPLLRERQNSVDIRRTTQKPDGIRRLAAGLRDDYGIVSGDLDLVAGGPPCQGYSTIGNRRTFDVQREDLPYNHLYRDMADVIRGLRPRAFLFENVAGLLSGRWTRGGRRGEIWSDVRSAFGALEYRIGWGLLLSSDYGVPQNRPRVIMVGMREDLSDASGLSDDGLLPKPSGTAPPDPPDVISDLADPDYAGKESTDEYPAGPSTPIQREFREDGGGPVLTEHVYTKHRDRIVDRFSYMIGHGGRRRAGDSTKKFHQRVLPERWPESGPNMTFTTNPCDFVHYCQPRQLTVREYARFQTFPDSYAFHGNASVGGRRRAGDPDKEVWDRAAPKYTQIGNAVPVRLARAIGGHLSGLLDAAA